MYPGGSLAPGAHLEFFYLGGGEGGFGVETCHSSYEKRIYRAAVSQRLRNTDLEVLPTENAFNTPLSVVCRCKWSVDRDR